MKTAEKKRRNSYKVNVLTTGQAREIFDAEVKSKLGISAKNFILKYQSGAYEQSDDCDIMSLLMLLPFTGYSAEYAKNQNRGRK